MAWNDVSRLQDFKNGQKVGTSPGQLNLNTEFDKVYLAVNAAGHAIDTHAASSDHDGRYYTKNYIDETLQNITLGQVPDKSVTPAKLSLTAGGDLILGDGAGGGVRLPKGNVGDMLVVKGDGSVGWVPTPADKISHTFAIPGEVLVPSGDTDFIPPFYASVETGRSVKLVGVRARINSGTSATFKIQKNGVDVVGFTGLTATTTDSNVTPSYDATQSLSDGDKLAVVVTGVNGSPKNMSVTLVVRAV